MMKNKKYILVLLTTIIAISFSFQSKFFEIAKQIEIYNTLFKELNINYINEINPGDLTDKAIKNTLKNLDPYTNFYNEQDVEDANIRRAGEYGGIGVGVFYDDNGITLSEIFEGFAADKAGLKAGDVITSINNQELKELEKSQYSGLLKGTPDTPVSLKVARQGKTLSIDLTLDKVVINPVPFFEMADAETGYIVLTRFNAKASSEIKKAFIALKEKGMKKLILDLRGNPGGLLHESVNIVNFFVPKGKKVVETKGKIKKQGRTYKGNKTALDLEIPIVVLINGRSASASEIVSGALQDYDRAVIIGDRSFGKGLVQRYFKLSYGTQLKATIAKYYTPSGRCIQELDYANRDSKTGKVPKFSDGKVNRFKTKNGRTVLDGGGVLPDIKMERSTKTEVTKNLIKSRAIFNFVTDYTANKQTVSIDDYAFSDLDFDTFKNYIQTKDTIFLTNEEKLFKNAYKSIENKSLITSDYIRIKKKLAESKVSELAKNKDILEELLEDEVMKRFHYKKGLYQHHLKHNKTVQKALEIINDSSTYHQILNEK